MFIFNFKIDGNKTAKILMGILCIVILIITAFICYKVIFNNFFKTNDTYLPEELEVKIDSLEVASNVFKEVSKHKNITKFSVEEPSLNEIFVAKVGEAYEK